MEHERPSVRFAAPSSEDRTIVDVVPWHKTPAPSALPVFAAQPAPAAKPAPAVQAVPAALPVFAAQPVPAVQPMPAVQEAPEPPPSVPVLVADAPPPSASPPRLRSDWAAIGATAIFLMLSSFVVHTMNVAYAKPEPVRAREVRVKGYAPAHDPSLREYAVSIATRRDVRR